MDPRFLLTLPGAPRRMLSRFVGRLARMRAPAGLRPRLWPFLAKRFGIPREEVPGEWKDYACFLDVFTRPLPEGARPLPPGKSWLSPADGKLIEVSTMKAEGSWLIKGCPYTTEELLPAEDLPRLDGYRALQIYLAPSDYHRFHAPCGLRILEAVACEGDLQPVDPSLARRSLRVLERNRRVLLHCEAEDGSYLGLVFVGALNVGGIRFFFDETLGAEPFSNSRRRYDPAPVLARGEELGRFELGSTILFLAPPERRPLIGVGERCLARTPLFKAGPETEQ